ncbi:MAG: hypothetical protein V1871_03465 [Planctomycetota bacterium]
MAVAGVNDVVVGSSSGLSTPVPFLATNPATNITRISATLNGAVNPNGVITTTLYFNYGLTPLYLSDGHAGTVTNRTASQTLGNCYSAEVWDTISGLCPNTLYYFRIVATNATGTTYGNNLTFTTAGQ